MRENMTNSEQVKWIFAETGRQIRNAVHAALDAPYRLANELRYRHAVHTLQNRQIRNLLDDLTDNGLIDRMLQDAR